MRIRFVIAAVLLILAGGCTKAPPAVYKYEIKGGGSASVGLQSTFSAAAGDNSASVKDGKLTVNGKSYGVLKDQDSISVDEDGSVKVNGEKRLPQ